MDYFTDNPLISRLINTVKVFTIQESDTDKYTGTLKNGKKEGYGKLIYTSGDMYEGEFLDDMKHGKGKMTYHKYNITLEGRWENDKKIGKAIFTWPNGKKLNVNWDTIN